MGGWLGGWGEIEIKANSAQLELELGLSLAIITFVGLENNGLLADNKGAWQ